MGGLRSARLADALRAALALRVAPGLEIPPLQAAIEVIAQFRAGIGVDETNGKHRGVVEARQLEIALQQSGDAIPVGASSPVNCRVTCTHIAIPWQRLMSPTDPSSRNAATNRSSRGSSCAASADWGSPAIGGKSPISAKAIARQAAKGQKDRPACRQGWAAEAVCWFLSRDNVLSDASAPPEFD